MSVAYEYVLAGLVMLVMLGAIQANVHVLISSRLAQIEQEDYFVADSLLDMILLSPGNPPVSPKGPDFLWHGLPSGRECPERAGSGRFRPG